MLAEHYREHLELKCQTQVRELLVNCVRILSVLGVIPIQGVGFRGRGARVR